MAKNPRNNADIVTSILAQRWFSILTQRRRGRRGSAENIYGNDMAMVHVPWHAFVVVIYKLTPKGSYFSNRGSDPWTHDARKRRVPKGVALR